MKQGKSLIELATEVERQANAKHDYVAPSAAVQMTPDARQIVVKDTGTFGITEHAKRQLAEKLQIPMTYFSRLQESHPDLLADNVNTLCQREGGRYMVRTLDGNVRALLSDKFRVDLDNYDLLNALLPVIQGYRGPNGQKIEVASAEVTDQRLFVKLLCPWLERELPVPAGLEMGKGHVFFPRRIMGAVSFGTSEIGVGKAFVDPGTFEMQCTNYATYKSEGYGKIHVGKRAETDGEVNKWISDETKRLDSATVFSMMRDTLVATLDGRVLDAIVAKATAARGDVIQGDPSKVVEMFAKQKGLTQEESGGLLKHLVGSGEMTRYGLQWAVTRLAGDVESYDRASDLERMGGQVIELPRAEWETLAKAA